MLNPILVNYFLILPTVCFLCGTVFWVKTRMGSDIKPVADVALFLETKEDSVVIDLASRFWAASVASLIVVGVGLLTMVIAVGIHVFYSQAIGQPSVKPATLFLAIVVLIFWYCHRKWKKESKKLEMAFYRRTNPELFL